MTTRTAWMFLVILLIYTDAFVGTAFGIGLYNLYLWLIH